MKRGFGFWLLALVALVFGAALLLWAQGGDGISGGIPRSAPYWFNGTARDAARGTVRQGLMVATPEEVLTDISGGNCFVANREISWAGGATNEQNFFNPVASGKTLYVKDVSVSALTAANSFDILCTQGRGVTACTTRTPRSLQMNNNTISSVAVWEAGCTTDPVGCTDPTTAFVWQGNLALGGENLLPTLRGVKIPEGFGIMLRNDSTVAGGVNWNIKYCEQ